MIATPDPKSRWDETPLFMKGWFSNWIPCFVDKLDHDKLSEAIKRNIIIVDCDKSKKNLVTTRLISLIKTCVRRGCKQKIVKLHIPACAYIEDMTDKPNPFHPEQTILNVVVIRTSDLSNDIQGNAREYLFNECSPNCPLPSDTCNLVVAEDTHGNYYLGAI